MKKETDIYGHGEWASVADCAVHNPRPDMSPYRTVYLYKTRESAEKAKVFIDRSGCGGKCIKAHYVTRWPE